jgi:hypothetical protein
MEIFHWPVDPQVTLLTVLDTEGFVEEAWPVLGKSRKKPAGEMTRIMINIMVSRFKANKHLRKVLRILPAV